MNKERLNALVEGGVLIGLALALSFVKLFQFPNGGSVTAGSMIPILIFAMRRGPLFGIGAGVVYGILQLVIEPFVVHPVQVLLDYPVAFGLLGLAGFFPNRPVIGTCLGIFGRFLAHFVSGVVFFASYAGDKSPWLYSMLYNGTYLLPELIFAVIINFGLRSYLKRR